MRYRVLGPLRVVHDGHDVTPTGEQQRRLLAALVLRAGTAVPADHLVEVLWPDRLPADHAAALQTHVFRLRRALPGGAVETTPGGYRLAAAAEDIDAHRFGTLVHRAAAARDEEPDDALAQLDEGLSWWRGEPYEELADTDEGRVEAARLRELRANAREERLATMLQLDRAADVVADLLAFAAE